MHLLIPRRGSGAFVVDVVRVLVLRRQRLMLWAVLADQPFFLALVAAQITAIILLVPIALLKLLKNAQVLLIASSWVSGVLVASWVGRMRHMEVDVWVLGIQLALLLGLSGGLRYLAWHHLPSLVGRDGPLLAMTRLAIATSR